MPTINDLRNRAALIANATQVGENTANRVGTAFDIVADLLEGMGVGQGILSIDLAQLNTLNTAADQTDAKPTIYNVTTLHNLSSTTIKVGTLLVFSDGGRAVVTQILFSNYQVDGGGNISSPNTSQITMYYRMYNIVQGTWSTWTLYAGGGGGGTIDPYPVSGSTNPVESNGIFERLEEVAPTIDYAHLDDIDDYSDMLAEKASYYTITKSQGGSIYRIGTLMVFANHTRTALYQLLATDFDLDANGDIITNQSTNGGFKLLWRGKIFSGNVPDGWTLNQWSKWHYIIEPNYEDIDFDAQGRLQFADKMYEPTDFSGLGRFYIRKNIQNVGGVDKNILTQAYLSEANFIYIIQYDFDLNGATINLPANSILKFEGGSIKNGNLVGNNTTIDAAPDAKIFNLNVALSGTFTNTESTPYWYGGDPSLAETSDYIQKCFDDVFPNTYIPKGIWNINKTLNVTATRPTTIRMDGDRNTTKYYNTDYSVIKTNADVTSIKVEYVRHAWMACPFAIIGGSIEQASGFSFTHPCVIISGNNGSKLRNVYIDTLISGLNDYATKDDNNIAILIVADDNNDGFANNVKIASYIDYFNIGVKIQRGTQAAWITGVYDTSYITAKQAIINEGATYSSFGGTYQAQPVFADADKETPFIHSDASGCYFYGAIWDLGATSGGLYSNTIGIKIEYGNEGCVIAGNSANIYPRFVDAPNGTLRSTGNMYEQPRNQRNMRGMMPFVDNGIFIDSNYSYAASYVNGFRFMGDIGELFNPYNDKTVRIQKTDADQDIEFTLTLTAIDTGVELYDVCIEQQQTRPFEKVEVSYYTALDALTPVITETITFTKNTNVALYKREYTHLLSAMVGNVKKCVLRFYQLTELYATISGIYIQTSHTGAINPQLYKGERTLVNSTDNALVPFGYNADNVGNETLSVNGRLLQSFATKVGDVPYLEILNIQNVPHGQVTLGISARTGFAVYCATLGGNINSPRVYVEKIAGNIDIEIVVYTKTADSRLNVQIGAKLVSERISVCCLGCSVWGYVKFISAYDTANFSALTPTAILHKGATADRPTARIDTGFPYFDTTLGKYVYWDGTKWIDGTGVPAANSLKVLSISQTDYDNLGTYDSSTLYVITSV
jgi:hypothetical protein